ncbi:hypothetical protein TNCV_3843231 [Trichonephila clavipes]|nr:hypothetical protein TNCV_3843231 [Trichonephila clavipes]
MASQFEENSLRNSCLAFIQLNFNFFQRVRSLVGRSSPYDAGATRGLLATDHVILNHGQVTWTTPELLPPSPNYHTTPTGGRFSSRQI